MVAQHPLVATLAREVRLGAAVLEDIERHGPAQAVWVPLVSRRRQAPPVDRPLMTPLRGRSSTGPRLRDPHRQLRSHHLAMTDLMARRLTSETTISWRDPAKRTNHQFQDKTPGENDL